MKKLTIEQLKNFKESEDKVEFKKAEQGNFAYDGGSRLKPNERRKCTCSEFPIAYRQS
jgi:ATP-dependent DNA helicase RecG